MSQSDSPVFNRIQLKYPDFLGNMGYKELNLDSVNVTRGVVYFCGDLLPYISFTLKDVLRVFYKFEEFEEFLRGHINKRIFEDWKNEKNFYNKKLSRKDEFGYYLGIEEHKWRGYITDDYKKLATKWTDSVIVNYYKDESFTKLLKNPCLKDLQFQKVMPAFEVYQRIETYLCNKAEPENPTVIVKDKDLITAKGYDKWSFRTHPKEEK